LFLTPDGEFAVFGTTTNPKERITTLVATGALVVLKGEVMMFPKWRLAILDNTGKEIGHFDPEVFRRPSSSIATA
jgi:hypothetical protein